MIHFCLKVDLNLVIYIPHIELVNTTITYISDLTLRLINRNHQSRELGSIFEYKIWKLGKFIDSILTISKINWVYMKMAIDLLFIVKKMHRKVLDGNILARMCNIFKTILRKILKTILYHLRLASLTMMMFATSQIQYHILSLILLNSFLKFKQIH